MCNLLKFSFHCFLCAIKSDNFVSKFILSENFLVKITIIHTRRSSIATRL
jgi:hypothetical protein